MTHRFFLASIAGLILLVALSPAAEGATLSEATSGVYDEINGIGVDTNASGNALSSTAATDLAGFSSLVAAAYAADFGGVIQFDSATVSPLDGIDATFGVNNTKTLQIGTSSDVRVGPFTSLAEISGSNGLIAISTASDGFSLDINGILGGDPGEIVSQIAVTVLSRDGVSGNNATVTANFSDGSSSSLIDAIAAGQGNDNTFYSFIAPQGTSISGLDFSFVGSGSSDHRLAIDDLAFITTVIPEPASIAIWSLIGLGLAGFGCYRTRRNK